MKVNTVLIWEGCANAALAAIKLAVGLFTGSAAILGDALHSLTDLVNNVIAFFVHRVASAPPDHDHPYGHQKFEQLAVFGLGALLTVVAVQLIINAFKQAGTEPAQSGLALVVMLGALAINIGITVWERYWAKRLHSHILYADAQHTLSDIFVTVGAIAGWQLSTLEGLAWLDSVFAIGVALLVLYLAFDLFRRAVPSLVDSAGRDPGKLIAAVDAIPEVRTVRRVRSRQDGRGIAADIIVTVDRGMTIEESHAVADAVEALLAEKFGINDTTVHIEPDMDSRTEDK